MSYSEKAKIIMLKKAKEKYESAYDDFKNERYNSCISNLYYSAYQTLTAYMITIGNMTNKHTHARAFVNRELAHKGLITKDSAKLYNKLMDYRSDADYNLIESFDKETAEKMLQGVRTLNSELQNLIS